MTVPDVSPDLPSPGWRATLAILRRLPQAGLSRSLGRLADVPLPRPLRRPVLRTFARAVGAQLGEVEKPLEEYRTVNAFFVRRLRPGARSWPNDPTAACSPVDGIIGTVGEIRDGTAVQAKGRRYPVAALLGDHAEAGGYEGGRFVTLYLSPRHYHRVHAPVSGTIPVARHVPGHLFPVNAPSVAHIPDLFARNERVLCQIDSPLGRVAVVAVGAYNVARISTAFDPEWSGRSGWVSNRRDAPARERRYDPPLPIQRGEELMAFHLGSTVILLLPPGAAGLTPLCRPGREVRLGEPLVRSVGRSDFSSFRPQRIVGRP
jgi:phosphatidylserine decarboxylase